MASAGVRWLLRPDPEHDRIRHLMARARRRRQVLDAARDLGNWWSRRVVGYLEVRWSLAARDLRDALDLERPRTR